MLEPTVCRCGANELWHVPSMADQVIGSNHIPMALFRSADGKRAQGQLEADPIPIGLAVSGFVTGTGSITVRAIGELDAEVCTRCSHVLWLNRHPRLLSRDEVRATLADACPQCVEGRRTTALPLTLTREGRAVDRSRRPRGERSPRCQCIQRSLSHEINGLF